MNIERYLKTEENEQNTLFEKAQRHRSKHYSSNVEIRSVVEISNKCNNYCSYCGMGKNIAIPRHSLLFNQMNDLHVMERIRC